LTIGELSQSGGNNSFKLTEIAQKFFSSAYLPINNMYYYPKFNGKRESFP
jgi:hypothetical protein